MIKYDNQTCTSSACVISQINVQKLILFFFRKSNYFMSAICKFQFISKKQHFSKPNSFDNFHFTLILLSNDLQYLCFFRSNFIHKNTLEKKRFFNTEDFYIVSPCQSITKRNKMEPIIFYLLLLYSTYRYIQQETSLMV